jgi:hypothetical protein
MAGDRRQEPSGLVHEIVDRHPPSTPNLLQHLAQFVHDSI